MKLTDAFQPHEQNNWMLNIKKLDLVLPQILM